MGEKFPPQIIKTKVSVVRVQADLELRDLTCTPDLFLINKKVYIFILAA